MDCLESSSMLRAAIVGYLLVALAVGPSLCCCAATSTVSCVRGWFGLSPMTCPGGAACSHSHESSNGANKSHKLPHSCHGESQCTMHDVDARPSIAQCEEHGDKPGNQSTPAPCPCKKDRSDTTTAVPAFVAAGKSSLTTDVLKRIGHNWLQHLSVDEQTTAERHADHHFRSHPRSGREILRALHILRC